MILELLKTALVAYILFKVMFYTYSFNLVIHDLKVLFLIVVLFFIFIYAMPVAGVEYTVRQIFAILRLFFPIFIFHFLKNDKTHKSLKFFVTCFYVIILFMCLYSALFYILNPGSGRHSREYENLLYGGYGIACAAAVFSVYLLEELLYGRFEHDTRKKTIAIFSIILMALCVFLTQSTLTFIVLIFSYAICYYSKTKSKLEKHIKIALIPLIVFLFILLLPLLGRFLISVSVDRMADVRIFARLYSFGNLLAYGIDSSAAEYSANRFVIPIETFKTFLKHPIFGVAYQHGYGFYKPTLYGVGWHCEFIDALANFGLLGGIPQLSIYYLQLKEIISHKKNSRYSVIWILTIIVLGLFNPLNYYEFNFTLFFMIPAIEFLSEAKRNENICNSVKLQK
jgi:cbb3-type cytochrome oxidase subunit 3